MAITIYNIKKWYKMLAGKSVLHVNQDLGKHFCRNELRGYYNNMKEKVSYVSYLVDSDDLPILHTESGGTFHFPVAIFQFAFGLLDFYYETREERYMTKYRQCADWAIAHQNDDGSWDNFSYIYPDYPYGSMAQGEGASMLLRAFKEFGNISYLEAAKKAVYFMLKNVDEGGCTRYTDGDVILLEYQHLPVVLNGWIFSWWGLYDYVLVTHDEAVEHVMHDSMRTMIKFLPQFANSYWSKYDIGGKMTSPFYHNLHIAQMQAMHELTGQPEFDMWAKRWKKQQDNNLYKSMAFVKKSFQKIVE